MVRSLSHAQRRLWIIDQPTDEKGFVVPMTYSFNFKSVIIQ
jgi:hypothetical protein